MGTAMALAICTRFAKGELNDLYPQMVRIAAAVESSSVTKEA